MKKGGRIKIKGELTPFLLFQAIMGERHSNVKKNTSTTKDQKTGKGIENNTSGTGEMVPERVVASHHRQANPSR